VGVVAGTILSICMQHDALQYSMVIMLTLILLTNLGINGYKSVRSDDDLMDDYIDKKSIA